MRQKARKVDKIFEEDEPVESLAVNQQCNPDNEAVKIKLLKILLKLENNQF